MVAQIITTRYLAGSNGMLGKCYHRSEGLGWDLGDPCSRLIVISLWEFEKLHCISLNINFPDHQRKSY